MAVSLAADVHSLGRTLPPRESHTHAVALLIVVVRGYADDGSSHVNYRVLKKGNTDKVLLQSDRDSYKGTASINRSARGIKYHFRVFK